MLLWGGVPVGGHEPDGRVQVLLGEGLRAARGGIFPRAPSLLWAGGNSSQAQLNCPDCHLHPPLQGVLGDRSPLQSVAGSIPPQGAYVQHSAEHHGRGHLLACNTRFIKGHKPRIIYVPGSSHTYIQHNEQYITAHIT